MAHEKLDTRVRREQIAEAAMGLVASQGLRRLSVAAVARRVGIVPSGIYRHFKSKDELLRAVIDRVEERLMGNVAAARQESDDPIEQLRGVLMRHIRFIREGRAVPRIIFADDAHAGSPQASGCSRSSAATPTRSARSSRPARHWAASGRTSTPTRLP